MLRREKQEYNMSNAQQIMLVQADVPHAVFDLATEGLSVVLFTGRRTVLRLAQMLSFITAQHNCT